MVEQIETLFVADPHVLSDLSWTLFQNPERVVSDVVRRSGLRNYALGSATSDLILGDCTASNPHNPSTI